MSAFTDFIAKSVSIKKILIEIDIGDEYTSWFCYRPGIWAWKFYTWKYVTHTLGHGNLGFGPLGGSDTSESGNTYIPLGVSSMRVDGTVFTEAGSIALCLTNDSSWYWDEPNATLYFHGPSYKEPYFQTIILGLLWGATNHGGYYNDLYYEPRLKGGVTIDKSKDTLQYGIMSFDEATFTLDNQDGFYDDIFDKYLFGQPVTVLLGGDDLAYSDYQTMFKGFVSQAMLDEDFLEVTAKDDRKKLSRKLPVNTYNQTAYPYINDKKVGKPIQLVYGTCYNVQCVCLNSAGGTPITFKVADVANHTAGIQAVDTVYVDGIVKSAATTSVLDASFTLAGADYSTGQNVTADVRGFSVMNSLSVITDIFSCYTDIYYASATFDTVTWEEKSASAATIGVVINEREEIYEIIERIAVSNGAQFLIKDNGTFSWTKFDKTMTVPCTVLQRDILVNERYEPTTDAEEFLTSVSVGYRKNWDKKEYAWYTDTSEENNGFNKYFRYKNQEIETYLTNATAAADLAERIIDYMKDPRMKLTNATGGVQFVEREIGDLAYLNGDRPQKAWMGTVKCEIVGITKELSDRPRVTIVGREVPE